MLRRDESWALLASTDLLRDLRAVEDMLEDRVVAARAAAAGVAPPLPRSGSGTVPATTAEAIQQALRESEH